jgi:hypothetical protein
MYVCSNGWPMRNSCTMMAYGRKQMVMSRYVSRSQNGRNQRDVWYHWIQNYEWLVAQWSFMFGIRIRVTRLGEFSPNGWLFNTGSYLKITEVIYIFGLLYTMVKFRDKFGEKRIGLHFGWFFSQTNLVTLIRIGHPQKPFELSLEGSF